MDLKTRMARFHKTDLYVVITEAFCGDRPAIDILDAALAAGVGIIQFREKDLKDDGSMSGRGSTRTAQAFSLI